MTKTTKKLIVSQIEILKKRIEHLKHSGFKDNAIAINIILRYEQEIEELEKDLNETH